MTCQPFLKQLMQMVELKLNLINDEYTHHINALERSVNHPSIGNHSQNPIPYFSKALSY